MSRYNGVSNQVPNVQDSPTATVTIRCEIGTGNGLHRCGGICVVMGIIVDHRRPVSEMLQIHRIKETDQAEPEVSEHFLYLCGWCKASE